jgi:hypothetical protein
MEMEDRMKKHLLLLAGIAMVMAAPAMAQDADSIMRGKPVRQDRAYGAAPRHVPSPDSLEANRRFMGDLLGGKKGPNMGEQIKNAPRLVPPQRN